MPILENYQILISAINGKSKREIVVMTHISESEEQELDNSNNLTIQRGKKSFTITSNNVYCYGEIDFHKGSNDCKVIDTFKFLNHLEDRGIIIPSDYDYDSHTCFSPNHNYRITETFKPSTYCRYVHGCLGKPQRVVLFKQIV